jgi:uncharacterized protein (UPF0332 family)
MAYHDELIEHAELLSERNLPDEPKQVDLRRAVSAAYYALFHLLTNEAAQNWRHEGQRSRFARMFDHGRMKTCCSRFLSRKAPDDPVDWTTIELTLVADAFVTLQSERHAADYDNSRAWSRAQVQELVLEARSAMASWIRIRDEAMAQDFLLELMAPR